MKLYHGTNGAWVDNVLARGLEPRGNRAARNNWKHVAHQSNSRCVYLTDSYAPYFAVNASRGREPLCGVIEVETNYLDTINLYPDEDALEQMGRGRDGVSGTMSQRTIYYRNRQFEYSEVDRDGTPAWQLSLRALGTCAHRGVISPRAITRALVWPHRPNAWMSLVWDPTITFINQRVCGNRYRALTAKLFGDSTGGVDEFDRDWADRFDPDKIEGLRRYDLKEAA